MEIEESEERWGAGSLDCARFTSLSNSSLMPGRPPPRLIGACLALLLIPSDSHPQSAALADSIPYKGFEGASSPFPSAEKLTYDIEWRLIYAGSAHMSLAPKPGDPRGWDGQLRIESGGLVSKLYKLDDTYTTGMKNGFCTASTELNAIEGKRRRDTKVVYDHTRGKASYVERDLDKDAVIKTSEVDIPACTLDALAGLYTLRIDRLEPGQGKQVPMSDGKKTAYARVEAQAREQVKIKAGTFDTIRYEIFLFNGVLYTRKADLFVWLTDDAHRLPVQIRARMSFPVGTITFELTKDEHP
jgi:Protein of unknown function (DUF3108)